MQVDYGLVQEQTQRLVMTAQMKQALDTLQWTTEELDAFMQEAMLENPLLEYESPYKMGELPWSSVVGARKQRGVQKILLCRRLTSASKARKAEKKS